MATNHVETGESARLAPESIVTATGSADISGPPHSVATARSHDAGAGAAASAEIVVDQLTKWFFVDGTRRTALEDVAFEVKSGEFIGIVGPSGCGKTTLLNCMVGLENVDIGRISVQGSPVRGIDPRVGYVTQKDTLLSWKTVLQNVLLPLEIRGVQRGERAMRGREMLAKVGLAGFENHMPSQLSGGMLKRASLARTLVYEPSTIFMDEPFGNLDAQTKIQMQRQLTNIWSENQKTVMFVTHDLEEAIALCDRIVVLSARPGRIREIVKVDQARPRDPISIRFEEGFQTLHQYLWNMVGEGES